MQSITVKPTDPARIARGLKRRPSYVQAFLILHHVSENQQKVYQAARALALDYYQCEKRVTELAKRGFIQVVNGNVCITETGREMKEILEQIIVRMHPATEEE